MTKASNIPDAGELKNQEPAPPKANALVLGDDNVKFDLQREEADSARFNTLVCTGRIVADWVMEPEVPKPASDEFLQWPTRRAFVNDKVQIRIQIEGHVLPTTAAVDIIVRVDANPVLTITTAPAVAAGEVHRDLKASGRPVGELSETDTEKEILLETDAGARRSLLVTTIEMPEIPKPGADTHDLVLGHVLVRVSDKGVLYEALSSIIEVVRWWAVPDTNLGMLRAPASAVEPLIDGENFFAQVASTLAAATVGHSVYLASWSFKSLTCLTGGAAAPDTAAAALDATSGLSSTMAGGIRTAAAAGAKVYILLDYFNAGWASAIFELIHALFPAPVAANVFVRTSAHPYKFAVGLGPFTVATKQAGSYHEKYVCLTGNGAWKAMIGGIDCEPDRLSPVRHGWRTKYLSYRLMATKHLGLSAPDAEFLFPDELGLWHDMAVRVEGKDAVQFLADDFVRRWNDGASGKRPSAALPAVPYSAPPLTGTTVQMVKTDQVTAAPAVGRSVSAGTYLGTRSAWVTAIREARHYISMENQYLRDPALRDLICAKMLENPILQVIIIIPFRSEEAKKAVVAPTEKSVDFSLFAGWRYVWGNAAERAKVEEDLNYRLSVLHGNYLQHEFVTKLRDTDKNRVGIFTLAKALGVVPEEIYPHSKMMIVDDTWAYIGSANANGRSLSRDAESGYVVHDRAIVTAFRRSLWKEHLNTDLPTRDIRTFLITWKALAVPEKPSPDKCTAAELASVQVVTLGEPAKGQKYNGAYSWSEEADLEA